MQATNKAIIKICRNFIAPYQIDGSGKFKLSDYLPSDTGQFSKKDKTDLKDKLEMGIQYLESLQDKLYAEGKHSILIILQAMDAAGKDGIIKHVMSGVNPQGCVVHNFKQPSSEEHHHDFLWRCAKALPERGKIGIFNRSYYEEVLSVRVHPEWLEAEGLSEGKHPKQFWEHRMESINDFEKHLTRNNTHIIKIFLHLSQDEQRKRFLSRLDEPEKNWKFSDADMKERLYWNAYQDAFEKVIKKTSTPHAPWIIAPADNKWYTRLVALCAIVEKIASLRPDYPSVPNSVKDSFPEMKKALEEMPKKTSQKKAQ